MKQLLSFLLAFIISAISIAQEDKVERVWEYLQAGENDKAEAYIKNELKKNKQDVDMLMMSGNVILNRELTKEQPVDLLASIDESIYNASISSLRNPLPIVVPKKIAKKVIKIWNKALKIEPARDDIHIGIFQLYSMALMKEELVKYFPIIKDVMKADPEFHYSLTNYARNIIERKNFDLGMEVYKDIVKLYPGEIGLLSDIAGEYFNVGQVDSALVYLTKVSTSDSKDPLSFGNIFYMKAVLGDFQGALDGLKKEAEFGGGVEHLLYEALFNKLNNKEWLTLVQSYYAKEQEEPKKVFAAVLIEKGFEWSLDNYYRLQELASNDGLKIILHHIYIGLYPQEYIPRYNLAEVQTFYKLYDRASQGFNAIENEKIDIGVDYSEIYYFYKAWANYKNNEPELSKLAWSRVINSSNFYFRSAACYFLGRLSEEVDIEKAKSYYGEVAKRANESKYATYCKLKLERLAE